jgi:hypothetical protein
VGKRSKKPPEGGLCSPNFDGSFDHRLIHATTSGLPSRIRDSLEPHLGFLGQRGAGHLVGDLPKSRPLKQEGADEMEDEIVDLGKVRESKAKEFDGYSQHMDGIRQQILRLAIKDMRKFSGKEEIAKTLRFAVVSKAEAAEGRAFSEIAALSDPPATRSGPAIDPSPGVRQFDCRRIVNWKTDGPERILGYVRIFWLSIL